LPQFNDSKNIGKQALNFMPVARIELARHLKARTFEIPMSTISIKQAFSN
jgi:hypothetical protein